MTRSACSLCAFWKSSIGKKIVVAVTGLAMALFLAGHLTGNLLIFSGAESFNEYAKWLHGLGHGKIVWVARLGLLVMLALHIIATVQLTIHNRKVSPVYENENTSVASKSSQFMIMSGLTVLVFIIWHIFQYTIRATDDTLKALADNGDPYAMVIAGFQHLGNSLFYIVAMGFLCSHLSHGVASIFQTLGLRSRKTASLIDYGSKAYALLIFLGFISIPVAIVLGLGGDHLRDVLKDLNLPK